MQILFSKCSSFPSWMIRKGTNSDMSHTALEFDGQVVHSDFWGLRSQTSEQYRKENTIVVALDNDTTPQDDAIKMNNLFNAYKSNSYDFGGMVFLAICILFHLWFGTRIPKKNLWQTTGLFICTEWVSDYVDGSEDSMATPIDLYKKLKNNSAWHEV